MIELNCLEELEQLFKDNQDKVVVVDLWAGWCGPCKVIGPAFNELAKDKELQKKIVFAKADVDDAPDIAEWINIECMPTFVFFKQGQKVDEMAGANKQKLKELVHKYAKK